jgi:ribose 1,5-bisphosphate isomerase
MNLSKTVEDIRSLKIQGAENIAKHALSALKEVVHSHKTATKLALLRDVAEAKSGLEQTRPNEPCMRNVMKYVISQSRGLTASELRESYLHSIQKVISELHDAEITIAKIGAMKIRNGMTIFTHCHSSTVMSILKHAKSQGKNFTVHNTETRPHFQGRITAEELSRSGIRVTHFVDSAARFALKKADIMLIGADAFTSDGRVINKIGSELFAEVARKRDIPIYVCTTAWKFDPETIFGFDELIELRAKKEIWPNAPKNVTVDNHAFEIIDPEIITGVISEIGVYKPSVLVEEIRARMPWMFG